MRKKVLISLLLVITILTAIFSTVYATDEQVETPSKYDLRNDITINIENQGQRGWCNAFAQTKVIQTYLQKTRGINYNLSEAYLSYSEAPYFGGDVEWKTDIETARALVCSFFADNKYVLESEIPNQDYSFSETNKQRFENVKSVVKSVEFTFFKNYDEEVKKHIMNNGGLYLSIDADEKWYNPSTNAIYCNEKSNNENIELNTREQVLKYVEETTGHAVTIIGWDDKYSRNNFNSNCRPENDGAWLILNSWGADWGNNGTAWVSYEDINFLNSMKFGITDVKLRGEKPVVEFTYSQRNGYVQAVVKSDEELKNIEGWETTDDNKTFIKRFDEQITPYNIEVHSAIDDTTATVEVNIESANFTIYDKDDSIHIEGKYKINSEDLKLFIIVLVVILIILLLIIKHRNKNKQQQQIKLDDTKSKKQNSKLKKYIYIMIPIIIILIFLMQNKTSLEDTARIDIQTEFTTFVDKIRNTGKITNTDYNELLEQINANGNTYELSIGIQTLEEHTTNKIYDEDTQVGENIFYETYTGQVLDSLNSTGIYLLQEGSIIKIELINSKNKEIVASQSGMVTKSGN